MYPENMDPTTALQLARLRNEQAVRSAAQHRTAKALRQQHRSDAAPHAPRLTVPRWTRRLLLRARPSTD